MARRFYISVLLFILAGALASAQVQFGVKGGYTSSKASFKAIDSKTVNAYHAGLAVQMNLPVGFAVQSGVLYQVKGISLENFNSPKYKFLEVPAQLQWGLDLIFVRPFVLGEYYWGYSLNEGGETEHGYAYGFGIDVMRVQFSAKFFRNKDEMKGLQISAIFFF